VLVFIVINVAMFLLEVKLGGSTSPVTLHRLGALEPWAAFWRRILADVDRALLHYGPLHLIFNLYALFVIGPGLERTIGSVRFATYYLLADLARAPVFCFALVDRCGPNNWSGLPAADGHRRGLGRLRLFGIGTSRRRPAASQHRLGHWIQTIRSFHAPGQQWLRT
jgi:hypothetical protein